MKRPGSLPKRPPKYSNVKTVVEGQVFDSKAEASRWSQLLVLQRHGKVADLRRQVVFVLVPSVRFFGSKRATPALRYVADFQFTDVATGLTVVEDVKGVRTAAYKIKRHLMKALLNIEIVES